MKKDTYIKITEPFRGGSTAGKLIKAANMAITMISYLGYPILLIYLFLNKSPFLYRSIIVPLDSVIIISVLRLIINRKRPYEYFNVAPAVNKKTKGKSFPSRHVFSACIIAMTFLYACPFIWIGIVLTVFALLLGTIRVLTGVHFVSDVAAGMIFGLIAGIVGFLL